MLNLVNAPNFITVRLRIAIEEREDTAFWDVTLYSPVEIHPYFIGM
jgi:hypothetical protein